jgi:metal-dependent amidase/aminoacylase/carboxypeptidase family protein
MISSRQCQESRRTTLPHKRPDPCTYRSSNCKPCRGRELAAAEAAVVTIGSLQAGTKENVIPDEAVTKLDVRSFDDGVRKRVLAAIERIVKAEAAASGAPRPPEITVLDRYPLTVNDPAASKRVADGFRRHFSADRVRETGRPRSTG